MDNNKLQLDLITNIKFPLMVGVILIHSTLSDIVIAGNLTEVDSYKVYNALSYILSDLYGRLCVPLFFFISGYLFFYNVEEFSAVVYKEKLIKRTKTILIPYVLWTLITLLFYFVAEFIVPELFSGRNKPIADYSLLDFISCFWDMTLVNPSASGSLPLYTPFWYIRDLLVVVLFTPLIYVLLKSKVKYVFITLLMIAYAFKLWPISIPGFGETSFCFFSLGSFFSINRKNFVDFARKSGWLLFTVYVISLSLELFLENEDIIYYCSNINKFAGIGLMINIFAFLLGRDIIKTNKLISSSCFFLYAYHMIPLSMLKKVFILFVNEISNFTLVSIYLICPLLIILIGILLYYCMNRYLPTITSTLTGSR
jgi:surface polysaccharide O-acyltransferase-like enzyme